MEISVDGDLVASGPDPSGSNVIDVPCDGEDHEVELTGMDGDGKSAFEDGDRHHRSRKGGGSRHDDRR